MAERKEVPPGQFVLRTYGRTELALLYSPCIAPESAWRKLRSWIRRYPGMMAELRGAGYQKGQRSFTPAQVQIIVDGIGEP